MNNLENILEIEAAIRSTKNNTGILSGLFHSKKGNIDSKIRDEENKPNIAEYAMPEKSPFRLEKFDYQSFSKAKDAKNFAENLYFKFASKMYSYYSKSARKFKDALTAFEGYTDKLIKEIEDWGVVYFRQAYRNLNRITPLGAAARYLQTMWVCVVKTIK